MRLERPAGPFLDCSTGRDPASRTGGSGGVVWSCARKEKSHKRFRLALEAIRNSGLDTRDIDAIIVSTTTPDMAIPSTAQEFREQEFR